MQERRRVGDRSVLCKGRGRRPLFRARPPPPLSPLTLSGQLSTMRVSIVSRGCYWVGSAPRARARARSGRKAIRLSRRTRCSFLGFAAGGNKGSLVRESARVSVDWIGVVVVVVCVCVCVSAWRRETELFIHQHHHPPVLLLFSSAPALSLPHTTPHHNTTTRAPALRKCTASPQTTPPLSLAQPPPLPRIARPRKPTTNALRFLPLPALWLTRTMRR